jgi:hypothetical protein
MKLADRHFKVLKPDLQKKQETKIKTTFQSAKQAPD